MMFLWHFLLEVTRYNYAGVTSDCDYLKFHMTKSWDVSNLPLSSKKTQSRRTFECRINAENIWIRVFSASAHDSKMQLYCGVSGKFRKIFPLDGHRNSGYFISSTSLNDSGMSVITSDVGFTVIL